MSRQNEGSEVVSTSDGMSRRTFTRGSGALVLLSAAPVARAVRSAAPGPWSRSRFTPWVGSTFHMTAADDDVDVVLTEVGDLHPAVRGQAERRFSLLFAAPPGYARTDGIRTFRRDGFGSIALFVTPVGPDSDDRQYRAIINRL
jgi:hypothetical protein